MWFSILERFLTACQPTLHVSVLVSERKKYRLLFEELTHLYLELNIRNMDDSVDSSIP